MSESARHPEKDASRWQEDAWGLVSRTHSEKANPSSDEAGEGLQKTKLSEPRFAYRQRVTAYELGRLRRDAPDGQRHHQAGYAGDKNTDAKQRSHHPGGVKRPVKPDQDTQQDGDDGIEQHPSPAVMRLHPEGQHQSENAIDEQKRREYQGKREQAGPGMHQQVNSGNDVDDAEDDFQQNVPATVGTEGVDDLGKTVKDGAPSHD